MTKMRTYSDPKQQRVYDAFMLDFENKTRGWVKNTSGGMGHGLWNDDGRRFRGASMHSAFWNGFDGLTLKPLGLASRSRRRPMYVAGSFCRLAYMAGRDCREAKHGGKRLSLLVQAQGREATL